MVREQRTYNENYVRVGTKIKFKRFGMDRSQGDGKKKDSPQFSLILRSVPNFEKSRFVPFELLLKIFHEVVKSSDHPLEDLFALANVSETWRQIILRTPSLWSRINFTKLPLTDGNLKILREIFSLDLKTELKPNLPTFIDNVKELSLKGSINVTRSETSDFFESLIAAPNLQEVYINKLDTESGTKMIGRITRALRDCKQLRRLSIKHTRALFTNQKWIADFLTDNGQYLEELYLTSSLATIHTQLFRSLSSEFCPALTVLDLSTCDTIQTHSFDAVRLVETMPNLIVLRAANVSFRRVPMPAYYGLCKLEELSMPIAMRDTDRDEALLATLAYGSFSVQTLDLRGFSISAKALIDMPSERVKSLHIDDICPIMRGFYGAIIRKWRHALEILSLVKINCATTVKNCLDALICDGGESKIRELDLQSSEVDPADLKAFLDRATCLTKIDLSACRSLPRGCKGIYSLNTAKSNLSISDLRDKLRQQLGDGTDSETEIDEANLQDLGPSQARKRRRVAKKLIDYVYEDE